jgi:membrane protein implicated in regulation of membrane protease activity
MEWWIWLVLGLLLLAIELFTPGGFYLLFFGLGAIASGALTGLIPAVASFVALQIVIFIVVSIAGLVLFRNALVARFGRRVAGADVDSLAQSEAIAQEDIPPGGAGKVELRGTNWTARNGGPTLITRAQRCVVERVDGLTLWVHVAPDELPVSAPALLPGKESAI